jgi:hypothetical protein
MKPETRSIKKTMALTPTEARAVRWAAKQSGLRGLAVLREWPLWSLVIRWEKRNDEASEPLTTFHQRTEQAMRLAGVA